MAHSFGYEVISLDNRRRKGVCEPTKSRYIKSMQPKIMWFGLPSTKPTIIITNFKELKLKELDNYGRGAKNKITGTFNNLTKVQRQKTPEKLIKHILQQIDRF